MYTERALSCHIRNRFILTNLPCSISRLRGDGITLRYRDDTLDRLGIMAQKAERCFWRWWMNKCNVQLFWKKLQLMQCASFSKSLNPRNINKTVSDKTFLDIRIRLQTHYPSGYPSGKRDSDHLCLPEVAGVTFSDSNCAPVPKFLNPGPDPRLAILQIWESDSCSDAGYNHWSSWNLLMFLLKNDHTDSCYCRMEKWLRIRSLFLQIFDSGSERKMQNPAGVDSGIPVSSEISDLCEISDVLLFFSNFASQNKEINLVIHFLMCVV